MSSIYPETSVKLRRLLSNRQWVHTVFQRHTATFIGSILFHFYLILFNRQLQQPPTLRELFSTSEWLYLISATAAGAAAYAIAWKIRGILTRNGTMSVMRRTWIDLIFILLPVAPAYFISVHDVIRSFIGLFAIAITIHVVRHSDRQLWRYHIQELKARQFSMLLNQNREIPVNGSWSIGLGLGMLVMMVYNGGADYDVDIPAMPGFFRALYVLFCTAILFHTIVRAFFECYLHNLQRDATVIHTGLWRKTLRLLRILPASFWLTLVTFIIAVILFATEQRKAIMPAMLLCHFMGCLFIHNARTYALAKSENRFVEWLFRHPAIMVVFSFILLIALGTYLLSLPFATAENMKCLSTLDAMFTATSAVCVTGLTVIDVGVILSQKGQFVLASLIQLGGLGIMTISSFVALAIGHRMGILESSALADMNGEQKSLQAKKMTKAIVAMTFIIEAVGTVIFVFFFYFKPHYIGGFTFGKALWHGYFMALNAFCNAGFALQPGGYTVFTNEVLPLLNASVLIVIGGIGYGVIASCWQCFTSPKKILLPTHAKIVLVVTTILIVCATILMFMMEYDNPDTIGKFSIPTKFANSLFQTTCARTAGMNSIDLAKITNCSQLLFYVLMFIGAAPGSTGGGIRVTTVGILVMLIRSICKGQKQLVINKTTIPNQTIHEAITVLILAMVTILLGTMLLSITMPDVSLQTLVFEVTSAMGTVGLTNGLTARLESFGKLVIIATMFAGRIGFLTFLSTVRTNRSAPVVRYPEGRVTIG